MAGNLSVGGVTGATNTVSVAEADSPMTKIQKRKIEIIKQRKKTEEEAIEKYRQFKIKQLGLPENATLQQIEDVERKNEAKKLGLPEDATFEDIQKERSRRGMSVYV